MHAFYTRLEVGEAPRQTTRLESFTPIHTSRDALAWFHPGTSLSGHRRETSMIRSTTAEWGWPAKLLHWLGAAFILVLLVHGWGDAPLAGRPQRPGGAWGGAPPAP